MSHKATTVCMFHMHVYMLDFGQNILQSGLYASSQHACYGLAM